MIHDVKDAQAELDRLAGGAGKGPLSLLRIVAWMFVGLLLIGFAWPVAQPKYSDNKYNHKILDPLAKIVTLDKNDTRGFKRPNHGKAFTIAWIGPSTLQSISKTSYTFIPADVRKRIPVIDGRNVVVDIYFLSGARIMDLYAATQAALHSRADMIVLDLNPLWVYNDTELQGWSNLNGLTASHIIKSPSQWSLGAQFFSPEDVLTGLAATKIPAIRDRWTYAQKVRNHLSWFSVLNEKTPPPSSGPLSPLQQVAAMTDPLQFWVKYRFSPTAKNQSIADRQLAFLQGANLSGGTISDDVVSHLFGILAGAKIPAYVYVPPLSQTALKDPRFSASLAKIENHLAAQAAQHPGPLLLVNSQSLGRVLPPMEFNDIVHVAKDGPMVTYLAHAICNHLLNTKTVQHCVVLPPTKAK